MALDLPIVDPHLHFWDPRTTPRLVSTPLKLLGWSPWLRTRVMPRMFPSAARAFVGKTDHVLSAYLPDTYLAEAAPIGITGYIHVLAGWHERGRLAAANETRWVEAIGGPQLLGIVGQAELDSPHLGDLLDAHAAASPRIVGVRDMTAWDADKRIHTFSTRGGRMRDERWQAGLALVGTRGLTFDAWCYQPQLRELAGAVRAAPDTRVVLCHLGTPIDIAGPERERILAAWRDDLAAVAACPNVHAKLSGLLMPILGWRFHERATPPSVGEIADAIGPLVEHALATFGDERCMFASNFPMDKVSAPLASIFGAFDQLTTTRSRTSREGLFGGNARRFYKLTSST
jgi:predicted TIM-barrel fold metal-dependent hydrolase